MRVEKKRHKSAFTAVLFIVVFLLFAAIAAGVWWVNKNYVYADGFYRRDTVFLDLRDKKISYSAYKNLSQKLPECSIRWSVPAFGGYYDSDTSEIVMAGFSPADIELLSCFPNLSVLDARNIQMSIEDYNLLQQHSGNVYVHWCVPINDARFDSESEKIAVVNFTEDNISNLDYLPGLTAVDATGCDNYAAIFNLRNARPELSLLWKVSFGGQDYNQDTEELVLSGAGLTDDILTELLDRLPNVKNVKITDCSLDRKTQLNLVDAYPEISFLWDVTVFGVRVSLDTTEVCFPNANQWGQEELDEILSIVPMLRNVKYLDLSDCSLNKDQMKTLCDALPETKVLWKFSWLGVPVTTDMEEVDLSYIAMKDASAVEEMLPYMYNLKKVVMLDCGLDDKTMDNLNKDHEDVRFVWMLHITYYNIRTDDVGFRATIEYYGTISNEDAWRLNYCKDLICLDIGHRAPTDLSFLYGMPWVKYLMINGSFYKDITPVGSLKNLVWLEMFMAYNVTDLSPLTGCTSLCDMNIMLCAANDTKKNYEMILAMPWVKRVWYSANELTDAQVAALRKAMPETEFFVGYEKEDCTRGEWRFHSHYYEMRDLVHGTYMGPNGGRAYYKVIDGEKIPLTTEFAATQDATINHTRW